MRVLLRIEGNNMKTTLLVLSMFVVIGCDALAQTASQSKAAPSLSAGDVKTNGVPGVNSFMRGVDRYHGRVQVDGVVKTISAKNQTMGLVDSAGCEKCNQGKCAELVLPVRWSGPMPHSGDFVRVSGEVQKKKGKLTFVASEVNQVQRPGEKQ